MKPRTAVRILCAIVAIAVLVVGLGFAWLQLAPRRVPEGQPALVRLDAHAADAFREAFNACEGAIRILVLLSPT